VEQRVLRAGLRRLLNLQLLRHGDAEIGHRHQQADQDRRGQGKLDRRITALGSNTSARRLAQR
jgi:hypothetical protein